MQEYWGKKAVSILKDLVAIPSINPGDESNYNNNLYGEERIVEYLIKHFKNEKFPYKIEKSSVLPNRENLMIFTTNKKKKNMLLLETHSDTVEVKNMDFDPFEPFLKDEKLYGRGSCDAKGQLVAMIIGLEMAIDSANGELPIDICLTVAVDEEHLHRGVDQLVDAEFQVEAAVVGEPTDLKVASASKGSIRFKILTSGIPAHTSVPENGRNAIYLMGKIIHIVESIIEPKLKENSHPLCGNSSICISLIDGGEQVNIVPESCEIHIDYRLLPDEDWEQAYSFIENEILTNLPKEERQYVKFLEPYLIDPSLSTSSSTKVVKIFKEILKKNGLQSNPIGLPFGCDASKIALLGIPTVVFGPGSIKQAHSNNEYICIEDLMKAANVYKDLILNFREVN